MSPANCDLMMITVVLTGNVRHESTSIKVTRQNPQTGWQQSRISWFLACRTLCVIEVSLLIRLWIRFSLPLLIMTPDGLAQTRAGNISSWFRPSLVCLCHGVHLYNLICYQVGQLLQQSLRQSLHQPRPQPTHRKSFRDLPSISL